MAFRIAVSGLQAASTDLDVTGNNIANAGTTGFKGSRTQFADVYAVSNLGSTRDAIGQGVQVSAVAQQFNQGNVSFTDNSLDMAVNGFLRSMPTFAASGSHHAPNPQMTRFGARSSRVRNVAASRPMLRVQLLMTPEPTLSVSVTAA